MEQLNETVLKEIVDHQKNPCISLVISTELSAFDDNEKIQLKFKNSINRLSRILYDQYEEDVALIMIDTVKSLMDKVDFKHLPKGIGLYVAPGFNKFVSFQFPVEELLLVGESFNISHLMKSISQSFEYVVVSISQHKVRLFTGKGADFFEVQDKNFPYRFEEEFQVHRTDPHSYYNNEESKIDLARQEDHFRSVSDLLGEYVDGSPIIILGVKKNIGLFKRISKHTDKIIGERTGNYDESSLHQIKELIQPILHVEQGD